VNSTAAVIIAGIEEQEKLVALRLLAGATYAQILGDGMLLLLYGRRSCRALPSLSGPPTGRRPGWSDHGRLPEGTRVKPADGQPFNSPVHTALMAMWSGRRSTAGRAWLYV
jgi:hypothetical protein